MDDTEDIPIPPFVQGTAQPMGTTSPSMVVLINSMNRAVMLDMAMRDVEESIVSRQSNTISSDQIESLQVVERCPELECGVCLEHNIELRRLACGHHFCSGCLLSWFRIRNACPMCRASAIETSPTVPTDVVRSGFQLLRQLVYAMMCDDARFMLFPPQSLQHNHQF